MNQPTGGYTPKDLNFNEQAQSKLINGITSLLENPGHGGELKKMYYA